MMIRNYEVFTLLSVIVISYSFVFCSSDEFTITTQVKSSRIVERATQERILNNCTKNEFICKSRECVKKSDVCNGVKNCKDGSDETLHICKDFWCPSGPSFKCSYGACIGAALKCNGRADCADKSDETHVDCFPTSESSSIVIRKCRKNEWRCRVSRECILQSARCNGKINCVDASDENDCKGQPPGATTTQRKTIPTVRPTNGICDIPHQPDMTVVLTDRDDNWLNISLVGPKAPKFSKIEIFCNSKYTLAKGEKVQQSVCLQKSQWNPPLRPCHKSCPVLRPDNIDMTCFREGLVVDCGGELINGTRVRPRCKPLHHSDAEVAHELRCQENGEWDGELLKCVPDCGIPNTVDTEALISGGKAINASDSPWHVAIYKLSKVNILICGGTLISANMVLTAAHCFVDLGQGTVLNSSSSYEVVVSKYTRDYRVTDNELQKAYKIREIIFTEQGFNPILTGQYSHDIAVLVLKTPVELNKYVLPACVDWSASDFQPPEGTPGKLVGWGEDKVKNAGNPVLLYAKLPFISYRQCLGKLKQLDPDKFCAGSKTGAGARKGDSGGGLMFRDANTKRYYVRGIVSTRDREALNNFATFTDLSKHIDWLERVRVTVTTDWSNAEKTSVGVCDVHYGPDKKVELFDASDKWLSIPAGSKAPEFSTIEVSCNPTYTRANGETFQRSVCFQKEKWNPPLEPCLKICKPLGPLVNIDLSCFRDGSEVGCNNTLLSGTVARPRCKNLYQKRGEANYRELRCQEDGEWDHELFECVPGCGVPSTELTKPSNWKTDWVPANASHSPWHVGIFKWEKGKARLLCSGTLMSAHLVLSAAECFNNVTSGKIITSTSDYEVVVSKSISDYYTVDNDFQRKYRIRELIRPYTDSRFKSQPHDILVVVLQSPVQLNKFVLPACIDWESGRTGFQPAEGTPGKLVSWAVNVSSVLRHVELPFTKSCPITNPDYNDLCTKASTNGFVRTWSWYNGGGLVFHDSKTRRYFLRGIASGPHPEVFVDIARHAAWLKSVLDKTERESTKAANSTSGAPVSNGICDVPTGLHTKTTIMDGSGHAHRLSPGWKAPKFSKIELTCSAKYALSSGGKIQQSVCIHQDTWNPPLKPCLKICQPLEPVNVDLSCYRDGLAVDCADELTAGTKVRARCKNLFKMREKDDYRELQCMKDGEWNHELFKCEPDCGIPNTEVLDLPTTSPLWIPGSDSPWHAAIFKRDEKTGNMSGACCGTLVSTNTIVTAGNCYFNHTTGELVSPLSQYEVYVSKYTVKYDRIDNDYQKTYSIRDILLPYAQTRVTNEIVVLVLEKRVEINKFVLPACMHWNSGTSGFRLQKTKSVGLDAVGLDRVSIDRLVSLQVELLYCSVEDSCAKSNTTSNLTWVGFNGGGLTSRDLNSGRYFLHGIANKLEVATFTDISKHTDWLKRVVDRLGRL